VIFPELSLTGYVVRDQIYELAETIPGPSTRSVEKIARKTETHIVFGMPELSEKTQATVFLKRKDISAPDTKRRHLTQILGK